MALARFDPPAKVGDLQTDALRNAWSQQISSLLTDQVTAARKELRQATGQNTLPSQVFNELTEVKNMADRVEQPIFWQGFPRAVEKRFGVGTPQAFRTAEDETPTAQARQQFQDEYLEWRVERDSSPQKKIVRVTFTCEGPEYWNFLARNAPDTLLSLYRQHVNANILRADLFNGNEYNPLNPFNTGKGIMHLIHGANTLGAEVNIASRATILRKQGNAVLTDADALIRCAQYGDPRRASDPHIGDVVNGLARARHSITLRNPIGLYISGIDLTGFAKPDGTPAGANYFRITRGTEGEGLRAVFEVPPGQTSGGTPFVAGDMKIGGSRIEFGGQIARRITVMLTGVACELGRIHNPAAGCAGGGGGGVHGFAAAEPSEIHVPGFTRFQPFAEE
jgi:hypothetical protein